MSELPEMERNAYRELIRERAKRLLYELGRLLNEGCAFLDDGTETFLPYRMEEAQRDRVREGFHVMWPSVRDLGLESAPIEAARADATFQAFMRRAAVAPRVKRGAKANRKGGRHGEH